MASTRSTPWSGIIAFAVVTAFLLPGQANGSDEDREELIAIEKTIADAVVDLDFETMDRTYADEFVFYHSTGVVEGKDDWLRKLRNGEAVYIARIVDSLAVDFHGDTAITSGRIHLKTRSENPDRRDFTVWYYRIYEKRDGRYQMLMHRSLHEEIGPFEE